MRSRRVVTFGAVTGVIVTLLATLLLGASPVSAASWRECPDVEYWQRVQAKGVSCATAYKVRDMAMRKDLGDLPINWKGRVGRWKCTYKSAQGPGGLKCTKGSKRIRYDHGA